MAYRKSYKPYRKNYGSNKKKWSPIMRDVPFTNYVISNNTTDGGFATMVSNSSETSTPTPTILKVKHCKISVDFKFDASVLNNGFCCVMFVPQSITPTAGLPILHPEWILAWRNIPNEVDATHHQIMLQSTMSRNLNSGDSIVLLFSFYNSTGSPTSFSVTARHSCVVRNN